MTSTSTGPPSSGSTTRRVAEWASGKTTAPWARPSAQRAVDRCRRLGVATLHELADVAFGAGEGGTAPRRAGGQERELPVDAHLHAVGGHLVDAAGAVGLGRPDGERHRERDLAVVLELHHDDRRAVGVAGAVGALHGITARHPDTGLHHRRGAHQALADGGLLRGDVPAVLGADPPVEDPVGAVEAEVAGPVDAGPPRGVQRADDRAR